MKFSDVVELDVDVLRIEAPTEPGIYEVGFWVDPHYFVPRYVGRARGRMDGDTAKQGTTIRSRLIKHASGRGNLGIQRAIAGDLEEFWLDDPDDLSLPGKHTMQVHKSLWCRWSVARDSD
ncbi:MAG: hypothetical protein AAF281_17295, partial [Pseudomonadota bacterium]